MSCRTSIGRPLDSTGRYTGRPLEQKIWRIIYVREVHIKARKNIYPDICRIADRYIDKVENVICN